MQLNDLAASVGKGLFAGLVGTAAITVSQTIEMKLTGRETSDMPSRVAGKVLGVQPRNEGGKQRFSNLVHWGYGTLWGAARGLLAASGIREPAASALQFLIVWGTASVMLPALDEAPPPTEWPPEQIATDVMHHAIYAAATGAAYSFIERN